MRPRRPYWLSLIAVLVLAQTAEAQQVDSATLKKRKTVVIAGNAAAYTLSMTGLYSLWYKDYPLTSFHFFNDAAEWNQMDKVGHAYSCYYEGLVGMQMMRWAGFSERDAIIFGGAYGFLIQSSIEVFDGFSPAWGASATDMLANVVGSGLVVGQELAWGEQRVLMKFSYIPTDYASIRPTILGSTPIERIFKDYNGQTYWLSANPKAFLPESNWPDWLNLAIGYGSEGLLGGDDNIFEQDGQIIDLSETYPRYRQWYLSPDVDLSRLPTDSKFLKTAFTLLNSVKFPLPAISYSSQDGFDFLPVAF